MHITSLTLIFPQRYPIVPLYGDMQFSLEQTIKRSPHYDEKTWGASIPDSKLAAEYEIQSQLETIRVEHNTYLAKFSSMINLVCAFVFFPGLFHLVRSTYVHFIFVCRLAQLAPPRAHQRASRKSRTGLLRTLYWMVSGSFQTGPAKYLAKVLGNMLIHIQARRPGQIQWNMKR